MIILPTKQQSKSIILPKNDLIVAPNNKLITSISYKDMQKYGAKSN